MTLRHRVDPLVKNGLVGYDPPAAEVWPESGVHGKKTTTLRQVPTHTVGMPVMPGGLGPPDLARPTWPGRPGPAGRGTAWRSPGRNRGGGPAPGPAATPPLSAPGRRGRA